MTNALREELFKLSAAERLELVEELWDSIADDDAALALTNEQREDLERRLAEAHVVAHGRVRRARLHRFPYGVYYTIREDFIDVLAVYHGRRRPRRFDL